VHAGQVSEKLVSNFKAFRTNTAPFRCAATDGVIVRGFRLRGEGAGACRRDEFPVRKRRNENASNRNVPFNNRRTIFVRFLRSEDFFVPRSVAIRYDTIRGPFRPIQPPTFAAGLREIHSKLRQ